MFSQKIARSTVRTGTRGLASALLSKSEKDWLAKSASSLRKEAKARGLSQNGSKVEIARRLMKAEQQALQPVPQASNPVVTAPSPPSSPLSSPSTSRQFTSSAKYNLAAEASNTKFTPKRPYTLNVQIPEEPEVVEEGPTIPYLPDYFESHHTQSASPLQEPPTLSEPRVLTVASAATHEGGGPSHSLWGAAIDPHLHEVHGAGKAVALSGSFASASSAEVAQVTGDSSGSGKQEPGIVADFLEDIGLAGFKFFPQSAQKAVKTATEDAGKATEVVKEAVQDVRSAVSKIVSQPSPDVVSEESTSQGPTADKLKPEEKQGLYALAGIVSAGYLLSKIFV